MQSWLYVEIGGSSAQTAQRDAAGRFWYCTGCRNTGCLNSLLCSPNLPDPLTEADQAFIARTLAAALPPAAIEEDVLVVLGGGMARHYPGIVTRLADLMPNPVEGSRAPFEAKSAAYQGLAHLATRQP